MGGHTKMTELRKDPLLGRWIITDTQSKEEFFNFINAPKHEWTECPFCEGNEKVTPPEVFAVRKNKTKPNTAGWDVRVVPNIRAIFKIESDVGRRGQGMYDLMNNAGAHEIIIETPKHIKNISALPVEQIQTSLSTYQKRIRDLEGDTRLKYALIYKNQFKESKFYINHAHSHLVAMPLTPKLIKDELRNCRHYFAYKERCLICDIIRQETLEETRIVEESDAFLSFVPFHAHIPFETWIVPKKHNSSFAIEDDSNMLALARILKATLNKISKLLDDPQLNYTIHSIPFLRPREGYWKTIHSDYHWHMEIYPYLMGVTGFEIGAGSYVEPLLPETCAKSLRETSVE
jgi:UDPglucose--hexose-1-phosphate uridylyltransferase